MSILPHTGTFAAVAAVAGLSPGSPPSIRAGAGSLSRGAWRHWPLLLAGSACFPLRRRER